MGARFVTANGVRFAYQEVGPRDGPLALCLHGFPDTPATWRHLLPELAAAGFRAVAPWLRGYAPSGPAPDGRYGRETLGADANALHAALGGDSGAVLIGHDWGAVAAYEAAGRSGPWRRLVTLAVPPAPVERLRRSPRQVRRLWYVVALNLPGAEARIRRDGFTFLERLWQDWSPGYEQTVDDRAPLQATFRSPGTVEAAVAYYRSLRGAVLQPSPDTAVPSDIPLLYLHGEDDRCVGVEVFRDAHRELTTRAVHHAELVRRAGHFLHLERPDAVNARILAFLRDGGASAGADPAEA